MSTIQPTTRLPWIPVPCRGQAISVEHPCIIKNVEKGIEMIGGSLGISQVLEDPNKALSLTFSPQDPAARTVLSNNKPANNVLLRISVPVRTNRKRKRGSNDSFVEDQLSNSARRDGSYLLRSMTDNVNSYTVDAITTIQNMHIWRSMPDFVYSTSQIKLIQDVKDKLFSPIYSSIRDFDLPRTYGLENTEAIPPPVWSTQSIPQVYMYRQNPAVKVTNDPSTGKRILRNTQAAPKIYSYQVQWDTPEYPKVPMPDIPPLEQQSVVFQRIVEQLRPLFGQRPIWTRRALLNQLNPATTSYNLVRFCVAYVAFAIRSGPWRDTYCRLGVDPRFDPTCRLYQSVMLQLVPKLHASTITTAPTQANSNQNLNTDGNGSNAPDVDGVEAQNGGNRTTTSVPTRAERQRLLETRRAYHRTWALSKDRTSHIFDGVSPIAPDGKVWQLCDITDSQLVALRDVHELHIRATCDTRYFGWYGNGTNAKIRVALKAKVDALVDGKQLDDNILDEFLKLPENIQFESDLSHDHGVSFDEFSEVPLTTVAASVEKEVENPGKSGGHTNSSCAPSTTKVKAGTLIRDWFVKNPSKQQLEWASLYRAFARTEPGKAPASGGSGKGRLSQAKLRFRKSFREPPADKQKIPRDKHPQTDGSARASSNRVAPAQVGTDVGNHGSAPSDPIDVDGDIDAEDQDQDDEIEEFEDGPELADGEEVLPSIEEFGFGGDIDEEEELDIDIDIKMEEDEFEDAAEAQEPEQQRERSGTESSRGGTEGPASHFQDDAALSDEPNENM